MRSFSNITMCLILISFFLSFVLLFPNVPKKYNLKHYNNNKNDWKLILVILIFLCLFKYVVLGYYSDLWCQPTAKIGYIFIVWLFHTLVIVGQIQLLSVSSINTFFKTLPTILEWKRTSHIHQ